MNQQYEADPSNRRTMVYYPRTACTHTTNINQTEKLSTKSNPKSKQQQREGIDQHFCVGRVWEGQNQDDR
jgi:hypothetical protein